MTSTPSKQTVASAMFLIAGICIGGGMLALPVPTGISGFLPSMAMMILSWIMMTSTGLLFIEVSLWLSEGAHVITMASTFLGKWGNAITWVVYLFICYASVIAYTAGGGMQIGGVLQCLTGITISKAVGCTIFIILFGVVVDFGVHVVGRVNSILFIGLVISYFCIIGLGFDEVNLLYLLRQQWKTSFMAIPLLLTSFSFHTMVPSLTPYLKRNVSALRWSVVGGTTIALVIYIVWECLILGIVPAEGTNSLMVALAKGEPATVFLRESTQGKWIALFADFFAFFAIITSFLGIALGLFDFLSDGLKIKKEGSGKVMLGAIIIIPTLIFAIYYEQAFLLAMDASGGFGDTILSGIIPVLMVWIGRYHRQLQSHISLPGGKFTLIAIILFFIFSLGIEILVHLGLIPSIFDVKDVNVL